MSTATSRGPITPDQTRNTFAKESKEPNGTNTKPSPTKESGPTRKTTREDQNRTVSTGPSRPSGNGTGTPRPPGKTPPRGTEEETGPSKPSSGTIPSGPTRKTTRGEQNGTTTTGPSRPGGDGTRTPRPPGETPPRGTEEESGPSTPGVGTKPSGPTRKTTRGERNGTTTTGPSRPGGNGTGTLRPPGETPPRGTEEETGPSTPGVGTKPSGSTRKTTKGAQNRTASSGPSRPGGNGTGTPWPPGKTPFRGTEEATGPSTPSRGPITSGESERTPRRPQETDRPGPSTPSSGPFTSGESERTPKRPQETDRPGPNTPSKGPITSGESERTPKRPQETDRPGPSTSSRGPRTSEEISETPHTRGSKSTREASFERSTSASTPIQGDFSFVFVFIEMDALEFLLSTFATEDECTKKYGQKWTGPPGGPCFYKIRWRFGRGASLISDIFVFIFVISFSFFFVQYLPKVAQERCEDGEEVCCI